MLINSDKPAAEMAILQPESSNTDPTFENERQQETAIARNQHSYLSLGERALMTRFFDEVDELRSLCLSSTRINYYVLQMNFRERSRIASPGNERDPPASNY